MFIDARKRSPNLGKRSRDYGGSRLFVFLYELRRELTEYSKIDKIVSGFGYHLEISIL